MSSRSRANLACATLDDLYQEALREGIWTPFRLSWLTDDEVWAKLERIQSSRRAVWVKPEYEARALDFVGRALARRSVGRDRGSAP